MLFLLVEMHTQRPIYRCTFVCPFKLDDSKQSIPQSTCLYINEIKCVKNILDISASYE